MTFIKILNILFYCIFILILRCKIAQLDCIPRIRIISWLNPDLLPCSLIFLWLNLHVFLIYFSFYRGNRGRSRTKEFDKLERKLAKSP